MKDKYTVPDHTCSEKESESRKNKEHKGKTKLKQYNFRLY